MERWVHQTQQSHNWLLRESWPLAIQGATMRFLPDWQRLTFLLSREKGFEDAPNLDQKLLLAVGELVEAQNELRDGRHPTEVYYKPENPDKPEGFGIELADAVIRIMNIAHGQGIDLETCMALKHAYNETRPYKHGRRF